MKRVVARYEDEADARAVEEELRDDDLDPERLDADDPLADNPFFDPSARVPEARGLLLGGAVGGVIGVVVLLAMAMDVVWIPRLSPVMTAGRLTLVVFGFGLGVAVGGFLGGIWGTMQELPEPEGPRVAVTVDDARADDVVEDLRSNGATAVDDAVTVHEGR